MIALSGWREDKLKSFFRLECGGAYEVVSEAPDVLIIDLDNYKDRARMLEFTSKNPHVPAIFLSFDDTFSQCPKLEAPFLVKKPYEPSTIKTHLLAATSQVRLLNTTIKNTSTTEQKKAQQAETAAVATAVTAVIAVATATVSEEEKSIDAAASAIMAVAAIEAAEDAAAEAEIAAALAEITKETVEATIESGIKYNLPDTRTNEELTSQDLKPSEEDYYEPNKFLYGHLAELLNAENVKEDNRELIALRIGQAIFTYSSDKKLIKIKIGKVKLQALASVPLSEKSVESSVLETSWDDIEGEPYAVKELLWDVAIWASRGRIAIGTDLNKSVALTRWPNMTRLREFPHAVRIAALWIKSPTSLINTAKVLEVPLQDVFGFYTVTQAVGISFHEEENDINDKSDADQSTHKISGLFSRILKHLKG